MIQKELNNPSKLNKKNEENNLYQIQLEKITQVKFFVFFFDFKKIVYFLSFIFCFLEFI